MVPAFAHLRLHRQYAGRYRQLWLRGRGDRNRKDSGLLIGLSAKVEIILSQVTDVYAVPYDAVGTDENGGSVVYARSGGETEFTAIPVETGMETDYYIEISGEGLSDGMEVKTSANDTATAAAGADDAQQSGENAMFSMDMGGGMPGGDMPGGGGMPGGGRV